MKVLKILLPVLAIIFIMGGLIIYDHYNNRIIYNDEYTTGNLSGNLTNGGLFCEFEDKIFYSNPKDNGYLYEMDLNAENHKKISEDRVSYLNAAGPYLYYTRKNNTDNDTFKVLSFNIVGIYRVRQNGSKIKQLYGEESGIMSLSGNNVYYQFFNPNTGVELHKVAIDKKEPTTLLKEDISPAAVYNNYLYYSGSAEDHNIHAMNLSNNSVKTIYEGNAYNVTVQDGYLYFLDLDKNYGITRTNLEGGDIELLVNESCSSFNISMNGKYLYYQTDRAETNRFCRLDLDTMESITVLDGNYKNINVTSNYVFFEDFNTKRTQMIRSSEAIQLQEFDPPIIAKKKR